MPPKKTAPSFGFAQDRPLAKTGSRLRGMGHPRTHCDGARRYVDHQPPRVISALQPNWQMLCKGWVLGTGVVFDTSPKSSTGLAGSPGTMGSRSRILIPLDSFEKWR
jgi:hypothetical protein